MRKQRELTEDEKQTIIQLRDEGMSKDNIAKEIGCGRPAIIKFLNECGDNNLSSGRKKLTIAQRMNNNVKTNKCRMDVERFISLYKLGYSIEDMAKTLKVDVCEVEEAIRELNLFMNICEVEEATRGLNLFENVNKDMTCRGQKANETYMVKLMGDLRRYPYLQMRLGRSNILYNALLKDISGNGVTRFDIVIPQLCTIIINDKRWAWVKKHGEDRLMNEFLLHIGVTSVFFTDDEPTDILNKMEGQAKFMEERERKYGHRYGIRKEIWS